VQQQQQQQHETRYIEHRWNNDAAGGGQTVKANDTEMSFTRPPQRYLTRRAGHLSFNNYHLPLYVSRKRRCKNNTPTSLHWLL